MTNAVVALALRVLLLVESSGGTDTRTNDNGKAVGAYQMHPCAVDFANKIVGRKLWTLEDRESPQLSRAMCLVTMDWHYRRGQTNLVDLCCRWQRPFGVESAAYRARVVECIGQVLSPAPTP